MFQAFVSLFFDTNVATMTENTFPVYTADAIVNFYRAEVLTGQEAKHFTRSDLTPSPKVTSVPAAAGGRPLSDRKIIGAFERFDRKKQT